MSPQTGYVDASGATRRGGHLIKVSILGISLALSAFPAGAETWAVRSAANGGMDAVAPILADRAVGQTFCTDTHCIVQTRTPEERAALVGLVSGRLVVLEELPDARRLFFQKATYDSGLAKFDKTFPGQDEVDRTGPIGQFAVIFRSHPTEEWLKEIERAGLIPVEPIPAMGYLVYGPREPLRRLAGVSPWIEAVVDIPAGLKRFRLDEAAPEDDGEAISTSVAVVEVPDSFAMRLLDEATSGRYAQAMRMGALLTYSARLTRAQATVLSSLPEVVSVHRHTERWEPADERSNRIVLGEWQTPDSSWGPPSPPAPDPPLPPNAPVDPFYQDQWLTSFNALGLDVANQTIGFLDTGIDRGKYDPGGQPICPPFLLTPSGECRLLFTTDVLKNFELPADRSSRADDYRHHGTIVASIAGGLAGPTSPGRDPDRYAYTQGTAPGAGIALSKVLKNVAPMMIIEASRSRAEEKPSAQIWRRT